MGTLIDPPTDRPGGPLDDRGLYRLMTWLSPNFPVGAFAYSHGLEYAVETQDVRDGDSLTQWVGGIITFGAGRVDGALFRAAWEAVRANDDEKLAETVARADALRGTSEMARESSAQGRAYLGTLLKTWPQPRLQAWADALAEQQREPAYGVAVAVAAALADVPLKAALVALLNAFAANLVSAGVRLVPLGQTDGQRAMADLEAVVINAADQILQRDADDVGSAAIMVDWMSMQHETQYTRLFRS